MLCKVVVLCPLVTARLEGGGEGDSSLELLPLSFLLPLGEVGVWEKVTFCPESLAVWVDAFGVPAGIIVTSMLSSLS